jgi:hypothetical protein
MTSTQFLRHRLSDGRLLWSIQQLPQWLNRPQALAGPQAFAGRRLGVLETRYPLSAVGLRRRFPENYEGVQCPNIEFATSRRMTTSPLRPLDLCAKMTMLRSSMLRAYATAIVTSSGRGAD